MTESAECDCVTRAYAAAIERVTRCSAVIAGTDTESQGIAQASTTVTTYRSSSDVACSPHVTLTVLRKCACSSAYVLP
jgi:hypothetical protein